jgi:hypothetical protein
MHAAFSIVLKLSCSVHWNMLVKQLLRSW